MCLVVASKRLLAAIVLFLQERERDYALQTQGPGSQPRGECSFAAQSGLDVINTPLSEDRRVKRYAKSTRSYISHVMPINFQCNDSGSIGSTPGMMIPQER